MLQAIEIEELFLTYSFQLLISLNLTGKGETNELKLPIKFFDCWSNLFLKSDISFLIQFYSLLFIYKIEDFDYFGGVFDVNDICYFGTSLIVFSQG